MTIETLAAMLDGRQYRNKITREESASAEEYGLVVVYGASDDLMEFRGAIDDELGVYEGGIAHLDKSGIFEHKCVYDCPYAEKERERCKTIEAIWCPPGGGSWAYKTEITHATFNIYEDDELYCVGIVFEMSALEG